MYAKIAGTGGYLPKKVLTNTDLEKIVETTDEWIENLGVDDLIDLIAFLDEHIGWTPESQIHGGYEQWRNNVWCQWEDVNNHYVNLEAI